MGRDYVSGAPSSQNLPSTAEILQTQLDLIGEALDASMDGFAIWKGLRSPDGKICDFTLVLMNKAGAVAAGRSPLELIGKPISSIVGVETATELRAVFERALSDGHGVKEVVADTSLSGTGGFFENTVVPFGNDMLFSTYRDVSDQLKEHTKLVWLSEHDYLTGMPNRAKLQETLNAGLSLANAQGNLLAFVFIDIDNFKKVNDTYGHGVGDALLVYFVKRIRHSLPDSAFVARISGDEFGILLQNLRGQEQLSELMDQVFAAMRRPFERDDLELSIRCSAGCALTNGSVPSEEVVRVADETMYRAKNQGGSRYLIESLL